MIDLDERVTNPLPIWKTNRAFFFKYMPAPTAKIVLENRTLRWSTPATLNDLYDVQFDLKAKLDAAKLKTLSLEKMWEVLQGKRPAGEDNPMGMGLKLIRAIPNFSKANLKQEFDGALDESFNRIEKALPGFQDEIRESMKSSKLLCLTSDPTNPPMWAHYADQNRGVVLQFRSIAFLDGVFGMAEEIDYREQLPELFDEDSLSNLMIGHHAFDPLESIKKMTFTKGAAWSYEKEWRISSADGRDKDAPYEDIPFYNLELAGVILGINMPEAEQIEFSQLASSYTNVDMMKAVKSSSGFHHEIQLL